MKVHEFPIGKKANLEKGIMFCSEENLLQEPLLSSGTLGASYYSDRGCMQINQCVSRIHWEELL